MIGTVCQLYLAFGGQRLGDSPSETFSSCGEATCSLRWTDSFHFCLCHNDGNSYRRAKERHSLQLGNRERQIGERDLIGTSLALVREWVRGFVCIAAENTGF